MKRFLPSKAVILFLFLIVIFTVLLSSFAAAADVNVRLIWDANTELDLAGYNVYYGTSPGTYGTPIPVAPNRKPSCPLTLAIGQTYYISVTAFDTEGNESPHSSEIIYTPPDSSQTYAYTVSTNPAGLRVTVDDKTYKTPRTFRWLEGSAHTLSVSSSRGGNKKIQYLFSQWDNGESQTIRQIAVPASDATYTANFDAQYNLSATVKPRGGGTITINPPGVDWFDAGQTVILSAETNPDYAFTGWSGDLAGAANPATLTMDGSKKVKATFQRIKSGPSGVKAESGVVAETSQNLPLIGRLESPPDGKTISGIKPLYGWALDGEGISKVELYVDGKYIGNIPYGGIREDVKEAYPEYPDSQESGFAMVLNFSTLSPGEHLVQVRIHDMGEETLDLEARVQVKRFEGETVTQVNPEGWLLPEVQMTSDGVTKTYGVKLEWSTESQSFEISEIIEK